jgi:hypothetical protein
MVKNVSYSIFVFHSDERDFRVDSIVESIQINEINRVMFLTFKPREPKGARIKVGYFSFEKSMHVNMVDFEKD